VPRKKVLRKKDFSHKFKSKSQNNFFKFLIIIILIFAVAITLYALNIPKNNLQSRAGDEFDTCTYLTGGALNYCNSPENGEICKEGRSFNNMAFCVRSSSGKTYNGHCCIYNGPSPTPFSISPWIWNSPTPQPRPSATPFLTPTPTPGAICESRINILGFGNCASLNCYTDNIRRPNIKSALCNPERTSCCYYNY